MDADAARRMGADDASDDAWEAVEKIKQLLGMPVSDDLSTARPERRRPADPDSSRTSATYKRFSTRSHADEQGRRSMGGASQGQAPPVGEMTHWERLAAAFDLKQTDLVPVAPELDYWQITYAGYSHQEIYNDVDKTTDACIKTWADLRTDAIWMYVDISHQIENFIPPEKRPEHFIHRGENDYLLFKPIADTLDEAIAMYEQRVWEKYTDGSRAVTHYTPHMLQLLEFQEKMDRQVPDHRRHRHAHQLRRDHRRGPELPEVDGHRAGRQDPALSGPVPEGAAGGPGLLRRVRRQERRRFCCGFGGARTWGPKHLDKFGDVDRIWVEKAKKIFPYLFWHICGHNLPKAMQMMSGLGRHQGHPVRHALLRPGDDLAPVVRADARLMHGKQCAMNAPTTQLACHGTPSRSTRWSPSSSTPPCRTRPPVSCRAAKSTPSRRSRTSGL